MGDDRSILLAKKYKKAKLVLSRYVRTNDIREKDNHCITVFFIKFSSLGFGRIYTVPQSLLTLNPNNSVSHSMTNIR